MKNIAVLVAMGMEANCLIKRIEGVQTEIIGRKKFLRGRIGQADVVLHICGMGLRKADIGTRALIANYKPDAIVNYGVSGGLIPEMALSDTAIASACTHNGLRESTDEALAGLAAGILPDARVAPLATTRGITVTKKGKTRIAQASGAVCVDMESYAAAKAANALGVPLLVIRSLSDTFEPASLVMFFRDGAAAAEKVAAETEAVIKALAEECL